MREIEEVICTDDGEHVLALCADGGVMYYHGGHHHHASSSPPREEKQIDTFAECESVSQSITPSALSLSKLVELTCVQRTPEEDQAWAIRRVGRHGHVVLARVSRSKPSPSNAFPFIVISLDLLSSK